MLVSFNFRISLVALNWAQTFESNDQKSERSNGGSNEEDHRKSAVGSARNEIKRVKRLNANKLMRLSADLTLSLCYTVVLISI